ncbi:PG0541 family transporter-associated protein [Breznakiella homolactica]|uniref:Uncharacterized protein n=1 Tax=Breznakiella homolactica TaxID=2798577 RepID=A0A7T7XJR9_9SPIR|nr:PG0541 family transporter-associated protein [Breznakiella homolactica]QQO07453.1 hypothetical protein JFL75_10825 [Breznakiella homolactica]
MKRLELFANRSVQDEIITGLEESITDFYYTLLPVVHGRGKRDYRLGSATWPEENFMIISYIQDQDEAKAAEAIAQVKQQFPDEGIKLFFVPAEG